MVIVKSSPETLSKNEEIAIRVVLEALSFKIYDRNKVDEIIEYAKMMLRERCGLVLECDVTWNAPTIETNLYPEMNYMCRD